MKFCQQCNSQMEDNASFCSYCGAPAPTAQQTAEREQDCLYVLRRNLRHERTVWRSFGILSAILLAIYGINAVVNSINFNHYDCSQVWGPLLICIIFAPHLILCFYQSAVLTRLERNVGTNCAEAVQRAERPRHIVLGAIFNEISWIFAMLNLIHVKNNKEVFNQIIQKQQSR